MSDEMRIEHRQRQSSISDQIWSGIDEMKILMQRPSKSKLFQRTSSSLSEQPPILRLPLKLHQKLFSYLSPESEFHLAETCRTMRFVFLGLYPLGLRVVDEVLEDGEEGEEETEPEGSYVGRILDCSVQ